MSARVRTVATAVRDWTISPVTMVAAVIVAVAMGVWLVLDPPRGEAAGPPATVTRGADVDGRCSIVVSGFDGSVWAAPYNGGELRRIDPAAVGPTGCKTVPPAP